MLQYHIYMCHGVMCTAGGKETQHDVWKYNASINKWIQIEYLNIGRWRHKMAVLGGKVYAIGGFDGLQRINSMEAYDPFHNCWSEVRYCIIQLLTYLEHLNQKTLRYRNIKMKKTDLVQFF